MEKFDFYMITEYRSIVLDQKNITLHKIVRHTICVYNIITNIVQEM